jgi:hypothetical protein
MKASRHPVALAARIAALGLVAGLLTVVAAHAAMGQDPALRLEAGSTASRELVAVGRDLIVDGDARSDAVAVGGSVHVTGHVAGDVIILNGDAALGPAARVDGDVFVLGGRVHSAAGAAIAGRAAAYPTASQAFLTLIEGPALGMKATAPIILAAKLALLAAWLLVSLLFLAIAGREVIATSQTLGVEPMRDFFVGLTAVLTLALTGLFLASFAPSLVSFPLLVLIVLAGLLLKLWGMVALFHRLGEVILFRLRRRHAAPLNAALTGLIVLGAIKLLPWVGTWVWTVASLIAVGASLRTKFGRREAWFDATDLERLATLTR